MSNIYDLANELNRTFRELPEYKAVLESKAAIDADSEAKSLFDDYIAFQGKIQQLMQTGQMPTPELQEEMKSFGEKIQANSRFDEIKADGLFSLLSQQAFCFKDLHFDAF